MAEFETFVTAILQDFEAIAEDTPDKISWTPVACTQNFVFVTFSTCRLCRRIATHQLLRH